MTLCNSHELSCSPWCCGVRPIFLHAWFKVQSLHTHLVASMESPLVFFSDSQHTAVASVNKKRNAKQKAVQETRMDQIVEVPNCEQIFRQICHHLNFSEITGNIAPPRNLNCLNIVNLYGSQHNRNLGLKKYHKSPPSWQVPLSIAVYFPSQKNSKQFCFFHVVFLSSLSSPAPWAPLLELPLSSAAEAEDHVLWRLSNFNLEKSKNSKFHVLKTKMRKCTVHWKRTCSIVLWNKWMPNVAPGAMGFQVNSNSWVWVRFFHIRPWRSISATSRAMFLESSKPQWGLRQWKR